MRVAWSKSGGSASSVTECNAEELERLMMLRGQDALNRIRSNYGGVEQLCQRLQTDPDTGRCWQFTDYRRNYSLVFWVFKHAFVRNKL